MVKIPFWLRVSIIFLLGLGIFFRFANLDLKPYWGDEVLTSLHISGYTQADQKQIMIRGERITAEEIQKYQRPNSEKDLMGAINAIEGMHPPLYYLMARFWMQVLHNFVTTPRGLSALISVLAFPCIYWLCLELFNSSLIGWIAIALLAVSPYQILYAQEAREYSLWIVTILLSTWALLRAMRLNTSLSWVLYSVTIILGFYGHLLSAIIVFGHGIYVWVNESFRFSQRAIAYLISALTGFLLFMPWVIAKWKTFHSPSWSDNPVPFVSLIQTWILNLSRIFFDFNESFTYKNSLWHLLIISLSFYSLYFLYRQTYKLVWLSIYLLVFLPILFFAIPDLVLGGQRSTVIRYMFPCYLGIQISIAYLLATQISLTSHPNRQKLWQLTTITLLIVGVFSSGVFAQSDTWWIKQREYYHSEVAKIIDRTSQPLTIATWFDIGTLSHSVALHTVFQDIRLLQNPSSIREDFSDVFVYQHQGSLNYFLENNSNYQIFKTHTWKRQTTPVNTTATKLWHLKKI